MIIKTYTKLCFYLYDLLGGQLGTERLMIKQLYDIYIYIYINIICHYFYHKINNHYDSHPNEDYHSYYNLKN